MAVGAVTLSAPFSFTDSHENSLAVHVSAKRTPPPWLTYVDCRVYTQIQAFNEYEVDGPGTSSLPQIPVSAAVGMRSRKFFVTLLRASAALSAELSRVGDLRLAPCYDVSSTHGGELTPPPRPVLTFLESLSWS